MNENSIFILSVGQTSKTKATPLNLTNLAICKAFKLYFDFCYFACFSPFRLKWNKHVKILVPSSFLPQKLICFVVHISIIAWNFFVLRAHYPKNTTSTNKIFSFLQLFFFQIVKLLILKSFWLHQPQILDILNYVIRIRFRLLASPLQKIIFHYCFLGFVLVITLILIVWKFHNKFNQTEWRTEALTSYRTVLFLTSSNTTKIGNNSTSGRPNFSALEYFVIVSGCFIEIHSRLFDFISIDVLFLLIAVLWNGVRSFETYVNTYRKKSWKQVNIYYMEILELSNKINEAISFVPLWFLVTEIVYNASYVDALFLIPSSITEEYYTSFNSMYWLASDFLFAFFCGEICSKVEPFKFLHPEEQLIDNK